MKHRRVRALLTALGAVALASLAAACFSDNTNPTIPDATADDVDGLDTGAPLDAPAAPDTTMDSDSEAIDATTMSAIAMNVPRTIWRCVAATPIMKAAPIVAHS